MNDTTYFFSEKSSHFGQSKILIKFEESDRKSPERGILAKIERFEKLTKDHSLTKFPEVSDPFFPEFLPNYGC